LVGLSDIPVRQLIAERRDFGAGVSHVGGASLVWYEHCIDCGSERWPRHLALGRHGEEQNVAAARHRGRLPGTGATGPSAPAPAAG
jgi:hypothetical protein